MPFLSEIKIFLASLRDWLIALVVLAAFFFSFNVGTVEFFGRALLLPVPSPDSFAATLLSHMIEKIVPEGVPLMVTGPMTAFVAQAKVALMLALLGTLPLLLYRVIAYLRPALYRSERTLIYMVLGASVMLFLGGCLFAYTYIVPATFAILYGYAGPIGATTFVSVGEFVGLTVALILSAGLSFMLPVVMVILSALGVVNARVWLREWRYAVVIFLVLSAIITPDGSGISMILLSAPVSILYGAGALLSLRVAPGAGKKEGTAVFKP